MEYETFKEAYNKSEFGLSKDIRLAINCAVAFYHTHEHVYHYVDKIRIAYSSPKKYLEECLLVKFPEFSIIRDITDCSKHNTLSRKNTQIKSAAQLEEYLVITAHEDEKGIYHSAKKGIYATLNNGAEVDLYKLLTATRYFWLYELYDLGILDKKPEEPNFSTTKPTRQHEDGAANMNLVAMEEHSSTLKIKMFAETPQLAEKLSKKTSPKELKKD